MADRDVGVLIVTAPEDVYYLSGLNSQGHFVFTALVLDAGSETATVVAREMEAPTAAVQTVGCAFAGYEDAADPSAVLHEVIRQSAAGGLVIGFQRDSLSFPAGIWRRLDDRLGSPGWVDCSGVLNGVRAIRSDREVACLRRAAALSDAGMRAGIEAAAGECTGGEVVAAIQQEMLAAGSDYPGFVPLVRVVEQLDQEHVAWTERRIGADDTIFLELSAAAERYHAPLGRNIQSWVVDARIGTCAMSDTALVTSDGSELLTDTPHRPVRGIMDDAGHPTPRSRP